MIFKRKVGYRYPSALATNLSTQSYLLASKGIHWFQVKVCWTVLISFGGQNSFHSEQHGWICSSSIVFLVWVHQCKDLFIPMHSQPNFTKSILYAQMTSLGILFRKWALWKWGAYKAAKSLPPKLPDLSFKALKSSSLHKSTTSKPGGEKDRMRRSSFTVQWCLWAGHSLVRKASRKHMSRRLAKTTFPQKPPWPLRSLPMSRLTPDNHSSPGLEMITVTASLSSPIHLVQVNSLLVSFRYQGWESMIIYVTMQLSDLGVHGDEILLGSGDHHSVHRLGWHEPWQRRDCWTCLG